MRYANEVLNHLPPEGIRAYQEERLLRQIRYCHDNSAFYRERFEQVGVRVEDIRSLEDFQQMPILMDKEQERISQARSMETMGHPYGAHICSDPRDVAVTATTSGTTGLPTFTYTLGHTDLDLLAPAMELMMGQAGIGPGDRMLFAHALGIYATSAALPPLRRAGILPIDVDVRGGAEMILQFAQMTQPAGAMTTPSLALHLIERIPEVLGISPAELGWRAIFLVGEIGVGIPSVKRTLEEAYGCRVYDWIAPAAETVAFSCDSDQYHGMHVVTPDTNLYPLDLVDPETRQHLPIEDGVEGEAVYTSLRRKTVPLLRYASGDIIRVNTGPCPGCGFTGARVSIVGRSDDLLIVKGANVYPGAIKKVLNEFTPEVTGQMRIVLDGPPPAVTPPLRLKVELGDHVDRAQLPGLEERVKKALHEKVRVTPQIEWLDQGELPRAVAKTPLFEKNY